VRFLCINSDRSIRRSSTTTSLHLAEWLLHPRKRAPARAAGLMLVALAALLVSAPAALGAWSSAVTLATAAATPQPAPQAAANAAGNAVVVWADGGVVRAAARSTGGAWSSPVSLSAIGEAASSPVVAVRADGSAVSLWTAQRATDTVIESASRSAAGAWTAPVVLSASGAVASSPQVAVDGAGNTTAVWATSAPSVVAATQTPGSGWSAPKLLAAAPNSVYNLHLAVNPGGAAVVGWSTGASSRPHTGNVVTRPSGGSFGGPITLVQTGGRPIQSALGTFTVAIDQAGRATAAWDIAFAYAASQLADGSWGATVQLQSNPYANYVSLAVDASGTAVVVWNDASGLVSATRPSGGAWTSTVTIDPTAAIYPGAGLATNGTTTFMGWDNLRPTVRPVNGSTWTAAGGWSGATTLDLLTQPYDYTPVSVAPLGNGAIATWANAGTTQATIRASVAG
jgi:hypothetical protein